MIGQPVGNYVIDAQIGEGGMGAVYRAHHAMLGRLAAIKVLLPQYSVDQAIVQRFFNEARAASAIRHLGIVEIYDYGLMPDGVAYIAMELLEGVSLGARVRELVGAPFAALQLARQICGALGAAHERGIVHRDLKPDNVFLVRDDEVAGGQRIKLLDFGIAKLVGDQSHSKTRTGTLMGTPTYMAPEQCRGVQIDHRADLYSLGCMLFEMLVGRPPFQGEGVGDVLGAHMYAQPPSIDALQPGLPRGCQALVEHLLAKDPGARPQTAPEVIAAIDRITGQSMPSITATPTPPGTPSVAPTTGAPTTLSSMAGSIAPGVKRRGGLLAAGVGAGLTVAGIAVAVALSGRGSAKDHEEPPQRVQMAPVAAATPPAPVDAAPSMVDAQSADAAPETIQVSITGKPLGSHVLLDGKDLGPLPLTTNLPRTDKTLVFTVRQAGYKDATLEVQGSTDIATTVSLVAAAREHKSSPAVPHPATHHATASPDASKKLGGDDSVNPYAH